MMTGNSDEYLVIVIASPAIGIHSDDQNKTQPVNFFE